MTKGLCWNTRLQLPSPTPFLMFLSFFSSHWPASGRIQGASASRDASVSPSVHLRAGSLPHGWVQGTGLSKLGKEPQDLGAPPGGGTRLWSRPSLPRPQAPPTVSLEVGKLGQQPRDRWLLARGKCRRLPEQESLLRSLCRPLRPHPGFRESDSEPSPHRFTSSNTPAAQGEITVFQGHC